MQGIEAAVISEGITQLVSNAFLNMSNLKKVTLPSTLQTVNYAAFASCTALESIVIPGSVTTIDKNAFRGCSSLKTVTLNEGLKTIGEESFYACSELTGVDIPNTVTSCSQWAFGKCPKMTTARLSSQLSTIPAAMFADNELLKTLTIYADSVIGENAFRNVSLSNVTFVGTPEQWEALKVQSSAFDDAVVTFKEPEAHKHDFSDGTGKCKECGAYEDSIGAKLAGYSLSLYDNIGVNFYMELADIVLKDSAAKFVMENPNSTKKEIKVSDAQTAEVNGITYYIFDCRVAAAEMTDKVKVQIILGDGTKGTEYVFSVQDYAQYILDNAEQYKDELPVVKAMLNYGAYAQKYFNYNTESLANSILADSDKLSMDKLPDLSAFLYQGSKATSTMSYIGTSLVLESRIKLKSYFDSKDILNAKDITVTCGSKSIDSSRITVGNSGRLQYVIINDIYPSDFDAKYTISVNGMVVNDISVFGYMQKAFTGNTGNTKLIELLKALYSYASALD